MLPISSRTLTLMAAVAALAGQLVLVRSPLAGMLVLGFSLAFTLMDGWWYPVPLPYTWHLALLLLLVGLVWWREPRGWFFLTWSMVSLGTSIRAGVLRQELEAVILALFDAEDGTNNAR